MPLEVKLTTEQRVKVTVNPKTPTGRVAKLDGAVTFTCDVDGVVEPIDDNSAFLNAPENPGDAVVTISADADLGSGVLTIQDTVVIHASDPMAASLGLELGTPETKPAPAP